MHRFFVSAALFTLALGLAACARNEAAPAPAQPPQVEVAKVLSREVTDFDEFTGRFEAVERVEVRPRVSGYITQVNFEEGREVEKGEVLFVIDPRPYQAALKHAKAELARARTQLELARSERARAEKLLAVRAISQEEFDARVAGSEQALANLQAAEAAVEAAELDLTFTRVRSPIAGVVGRAYITAGNHVRTGETLLTTVVSIDPIYVEFEGDERAYLRYLELARQNGEPRPRDAHVPLWVGLAGETGHPHEGVMVFIDNALDPATGTIRARGLLENAERRFTPGMFARVKLVGSAPYEAVLVNDSAIGTDQSIKYVLVVGANNTVEYRPVKLGPLVDGLRVVREGLSPDDMIVVNGLMRVRPGTPITPQLVAMGERGSRTDLVARTTESRQ